MHSTALPNQYATWQDFLCALRDKFPDLSIKTLTVHRQKRLYEYKGLLEKGKYIYVEDVLLNAAVEMLGRA